MSHVFISYARRDGRAHADRLDAALRESGYRTWIDRRDISADKDFTAEIEQGIEAASALVLCLTPDAKQQDSFVRREVHYADMAQKPIYVARLDANTLPFVNVVTHTFIDFHKDWDASVRQLCAQLAKPTPAVIPSAPAHPLCPYVQRLYESAKTHLDTAIIKLIDLEISETPDAVPTQPLDMIEMLFGDAHGENEFHSFAEAFAHFNKRALLLGEPGAGKTVTLMSTARQAAADWLSDPAVHPLPVLGIIATWDSAKQPPLAEWLGAQKGLTPDALRGTMSVGNALLLLDGLDELGGERTEERKDEHTGEKFEIRYDPRQRFIAVLNEQLGTNRALVTCRIADYEAIGQHVTLDGAVTLQRLTDAQMRVYLADLPDLQAAIDADEGLREMARTPLLLSYLAFGFRDRPDAVKELHDLREGALRDAIFNAYMEKRYDREVKRLAKQGKSPPFTLDYIREVLGRLAMENAGNKWRRTIRYSSQNKDNVLEHVDFELVMLTNEIDDFVAFCINLHYLQKRAENLGFVHLRLRDTLIYGYSLSKLYSIELYTTTYEPNPAIALSVTQDMRVCEELINLLNAKSLTPIMRRCATEALGVLGGSYAIEQLVRALTDIDGSVRRIATDALLKLGNPAVKPLIHALANVDVGIRNSAARTLVALGKCAVEPLIRTLQDGNGELRGSAAAILGQIGDPHVIEPLSRALTDSDRYVRRYAAELLGKIGGARAVELLIQAMGDVNADVRSCTAAALGQSGDPRAVKPLIQALNDTDFFVRRGAADALGRIGASAVTPLIQVLGQKNANVRSLAAFSLGQIGDPRAVEPLAQALDDIKREWMGRRICDTAADALERIGTPEALAAVRAWREGQKGG